MKLAKILQKKVRDIILPAGAENANRMANKCLNCNLCIENCPNKILTKADESFPAVHIDYTKGEGFCKYNCHKCSQVCPSGAIKRLSLEEKQNTRIAMAMIKEDKCTNCSICIHNCPKDAISKIDDKIIINGSKCIGCGKCAKSCPNNATEIFGINEQRKI